MLQLQCEKRKGPRLLCGVRETWCGVFRRWHRPCKFDGYYMEVVVPGRRIVLDTQGSYDCTETVAVALVAAVERMVGSWLVQSCVEAVDLELGAYTEYHYLESIVLRQGLVGGMNMC